MNFADFLVNFQKILIHYFLVIVEFKNTLQIMEIYVLLFHKLFIFLAISNMALSHTALFVRAKQFQQYLEGGMSLWTSVTSLSKDTYDCDS